jgi:ribosomal protein L44E
MRCPHGHSTLYACPICRRHSRHDVDHSYEANIRGRPSILGSRDTGWASTAYRSSRPLFTEDKDTSKRDD